MKKLFLIFLLNLVSYNSFAENTEQILNRVFSSSDNTLKATITGTARISSVSSDAISGINFTSQNIKFLDPTCDLQTEITNSDSGDVLYLGPGDYSFSSGLSITSKTLTIIGSGEDTNLIFTGTTGDAIAFNAGTTGSSVRDLKITYTTATSGTVAAIKVDRSGTTVSDDYYFENIKIISTLTATSGGGIRGITLIDCGATLVNVRGIINNSGASGASTGYGIQHINQSTAEANTTSYIYNCDFRLDNTSAVTGNHYAYFSNDNSSSNDSIMNIYNCVGVVSDTGGTVTNAYGIGATGSDAFINLYEGFYNGADGAIQNNSSANITVYNSSFGSRTISGSVSIGGNIYFETAKLSGLTIGGTLPSASASNSNTVALVTNANASTDCTTGGGSTYNLCLSNGTAWIDI